MKFNDARQAFEAIHIILNGEKVGDEVRRFRVPPRGGYWLGRIYRDLAAKYSKLEADRLDLITRLGTTLPDGSKQITPDGDGWAELQALLNEEVDCAFSVKLSDLGDDPDVGALVAALGNIVVDDAAAD